MHKVWLIIGALLASLGIGMETPSHVSAGIGNCSADTRLVTVVVTCSYSPYNHYTAFRAKGYCHSGYAGYPNYWSYGNWTNLAHPNSFAYCYKDSPNDRVSSWSVSFY